MNKKRIWELDALRGFFVLCMIAVHIIYDLVELYGIIDWDYPPAYIFFNNRISTMFLLISGCCATLGKRSVRRGLQVLGCGMLVTATTVGMYLLNLTGKGIIIYFGALHCLGTCMILWPLFKKCPTWLLAVLGAVIFVIGLQLQHRATVDFPWLIPLGFLYPGFASSDYFPLLPNLGYFLLGAVLGRTLYVKKESLLPNVSTNNPVIRFLSGCGKHALLIYIVHQPIIAALCGGLAWLLG